MNYANDFSANLVMELLKNTGINKYAIELIEGKQPIYGLIYSLSLLELETLKAYIEIHLKTRFIWPIKSPTYAPILFDKNLDRNLWLCVDYQDFIYLTIKNWYLLPLLINP